MLTLDLKERNAFQKFLLSPYFNQREDLVKLWNLIKQHLPEPLSKEEIHRHLFGNTPFEDQRIRLLMSWLHQQLEQFLLLEQYQSDKIRCDLDRLAIYRKRKLAKRFKTVSKRIKNQWKKQSLYDRRYEYQKYLYAIQHYHLGNERKRLNPKLLQETSTQLDIFYIAEKLRISCTAISHLSVSNAKHDFGLTEKLIEKIQKEPIYLTYASIAVYYYCFLLLKYPEKEIHYDNFKKTILANDEFFTAKEMRDLYVSAINFCLYRYNKGETHYINELMVFYRSGLEKRYFLDNGTLSRFTFRNIVSTALVIEDYDWLEEFIEGYHSYLEEHFRMTSYKFSHARLAYARKQYEKALSLFESTDYQDVLINLSAKTVMAKIYYQLDEFIVLESHLSAMQSYIRRKEVSESYRKLYNNFVFYLQKIMLLNPYDQNAKKDLKEKIDNNKAIAERSWLQRIMGDTSLVLPK